MDSEVYRAILSAQIQSNATKLIGRHFTVQMNNNPKHTAKAIQSSDLSLIEHAFDLLTTEWKAENPQIRSN